MATHGKPTTSILVWLIPLFYLPIGLATFDVPIPPPGHNWKWVALCCNVAARLPCPRHACVVAVRNLSTLRS